MSAYIIQSSTLTGIADALRSKTGLFESFTPAQMISAIEDISGDAVLSSVVFTSNGTYTPDAGYDGFNNVVVSVSTSGGSSDSIWAALVERTSSLAIDDVSGETKTIGSYAFYSHQKLTAVNFPSCSSIGDYAFNRASSLESAIFPACEMIGLYAFASCKSMKTANFPACVIVSSYAFAYAGITSASFPSCTTIGERAFAQCQFSSVDLPSCVTMGSYAFDNCDSLQTINLPMCSAIAVSAFSGCNKLTEVNASACTEVGSSAFRYGSKLATVNIPSCQTLHPYAFAYCYSLPSISLPACNQIKTSAFYGCSRLISVWLGSSFCALAGSNAFSSTPIGGYSTVAGQYGSVFVPESLYSTYIADSVWAYLSSRIVSVA